jgi:hypothetical protein
MEQLDHFAAATAHQPHLATDLTQTDPATGRYAERAFSGELMAQFCELLATTGTVSSAAAAVGVSRDTVYQHRRRNPLFAAAWAGALSHVRHRLADRLLERALDGSVDYIYRDGQLVGERHHMDNRLAYAMLRRLDQQVEADPAPVAAELARQQAERVPTKADYRTALKALRTGSEEDLCAALAMFGPDGQPDTSDNPLGASLTAVRQDEDEREPERVWERRHGEWWTSFPPPASFDGEEEGHWSDPDYRRECTGEEAAIMNARRDAELADYRVEEEEERDAFFAALGTSGEEEDASSSLPLRDKDEGMETSEPAPQPDFRPFQPTAPVRLPGPLDRASHDTPA